MSEREQRSAQLARLHRALSTSITWTSLATPLIEELDTALLPLRALLLSVDPGGPSHDADADADADECEMRRVFDDDAAEICRRFGGTVSGAVEAEDASEPPAATPSKSPIRAPRVRKRAPAPRPVSEMDCLLCGRAVYSNNNKLSRSCPKPGSSTCRILGMGRLLTSEAEEDSVEDLQLFFKACLENVSAHAPVHFNTSWLRVTQSGERVLPPRRVCASAACGFAVGKSADQAASEALHNPSDGSDSSDALALSQRQRRFLTTCKAALRAFEQDVETAAFFKAFAVDGDVSGGDDGVDDGGGGGDGKGGKDDADAGGEVDRMSRGLKGVLHCSTCGGHFPNGQHQAGSRACKKRVRQAAQESKAEAEKTSRASTTCPYCDSTVDLSARAQRRHITFSHACRRAHTRLSQERQAQIQVEMGTIRRCSYCLTLPLRSHQRMGRQCREAHSKLPEETRRRILSGLQDASEEESGEEDSGDDAVEDDDDASRRSSLPTCAACLRPLRSASRKSSGPVCSRPWGAECVAVVREAATRASSRYLPPRPSAAGTPDASEPESGISPSDATLLSALGLLDDHSAEDRRPLLLFGGPGAGKTFALLRLYSRLQAWASMRGTPEAVALVTGYGVLSQTLGACALLSLSCVSCARSLSSISESLSPSLLSSQVVRRCTLGLVWGKDCLAQLIQRWLASRKVRLAPPFFAFLALLLHHHQRT